MLRPTQRPSPLGLIGLVLALWALASQVATGAVVLPQDLAERQSAIAQLDASTVLCIANSGVGHGAPVPHHHAPDCALCPLHAAMAAGGLILAHAPAIPRPASAPMGRGVSPTSARGPPPAPHSTAFPRGPPTFA